MKKQKWVCELCGQQDEAEYRAGTGVIGVYYAIEDSHKKVSPDCKQPITKIRVINEDYNTDISSDKKETK